MISCRKPKLEVISWFKLERKTDSYKLPARIGSYLFSLLIFLNASYAFGDNQLILNARLTNDAIVGDTEGVREDLAQGAYINFKNGGGSALHFAVTGGYVEVVRLLVSAGAEINIRDRDGETPLHKAVRFNRVEMVKILLLAGANPNISSKINNFHSGETPLHVSVNSIPEIVKLLLQYGAEVNALTSNNETSLDLATNDKGIKILLLHNAKIGGFGVDKIHRLSRPDFEMFSAIYSDDGDQLRHAILMGANVNTHNSQNLTPLSLASQIGRTKIIEKLIDHGADIQATGKFWYTALHWAVIHRNIKVAKILLAHGALVNTKDARTDAPLDYSENAALSKLLIKSGANMDKSLQKICSNFYSVSRKFVETLVVNGANPNDSSRCNILFYSLAYRTKYVVPTLLNYGADPNGTDEKGTPVIVKAAESDDASIVSALLDHGAKINAPDERGNTALHLASRYGNENVVKVLINHKANVALTNLDNETALYIVQKIDIADALIKAGAQPEELLPRFWKLRKPTKREVELFRIIATDDFKQLKGLSASDLLAPEPDTGGQLLLNLAISFGRTKIVGWLLDHGADPNLADVNGTKPIHRAVLLATFDAQKKIKILNLLLNKGAQINANSYPGGLSALQLAIAMSDKDIVDFLLKKQAVLLTGEIDYRAAITSAQNSEIDRGPFGVYLDRGFPFGRLTLDVVRKYMTNQ